MLRQQIKEGTKLGSLAASYVLNGELLPDNLITRVVVSHLDQTGWLVPSANWLLDGFPRTAEQAKMLGGELSKVHCNLNLVVELDVPHDIILKRIENRFVHIPSGRIYNLEYNPPKVPGKDDVTGEPLSKRPDDNPEVFSKRLREYARTMAPLREFYAMKDILKTVSGETSDIIFPKLCKLIEEGKY